MKLIISNVSGVPIYEQIKQQIKAAILSGELQAEETLPSLRTLAKDLKISVLTVTKAYTELEQEGFVKNVQGRGCFVMGSGSELIKEQLICKVENNLTEAIKAARMANLSTEELHRLLDILTEVKTDDYDEVKDFYDDLNVKLVRPAGDMLGLHSEFLPASKRYINDYVQYVKSDFLAGLGFEMCIRDRLWEMCIIPKKK